MIRILNLMLKCCFFHRSSIHVHSLEESVVEKVVDVLHSQLVSLLTALFGNNISCDGDVSPTPVGTPDTPVVSLSPVTESQKSVCSLPLVSL